MLSAEEKKEKLEFFRDLNRLLVVDDEDDGQGGFSSGKVLSKSIPNEPKIKVPGSDPPLTREVTNMERFPTRKRKPTEDVLQSEKRAAPHPRLGRTSSLPEQGLKQKTPLNPSLARSATLPEQGSMKSKALQSGKPFTDLSNLEARINGTERPKLRPLKKGKTWKKPAEIEPEQQIFRGLVFCKHTRV